MHMQRIQDTDDIALSPLARSFLDVLVAHLGVTSMLTGEERAYVAARGALMLADRLPPETAAALSPILNMALKAAAQEAGRSAPLPPAADPAR